MQACCTNVNTSLDTGTAPSDTRIDSKTIFLNVTKIKNISYLPLGLGASHNGDLALLRLLVGLLLLEGGDLDGGSAVADDVADVQALGADDGANRVVGDVQEGCLLGIASASLGARGGGVEGGGERGRRAAVRPAATGGHHGHGVQAREHYALGGQCL